MSPQQDTAFLNRIQEMKGWKKVIEKYANIYWRKKLYLPIRYPNIVWKKEPLQANGLVKVDTNSAPFNASVIESKITWYSSEGFISTFNILASDLYKIIQLHNIYGSKCIMKFFTALHCHRMKQLYEGMEWNFPSSIDMKKAKIWARGNIECDMPKTIKLSQLDNN